MSDAESTALAIREGASLPEESWPFERIKAVVDTVAPDNASRGEVIQFLSLAHRYQLDPFAGEIWLAKTSQGIKPVTGRDSFIKIAERDYPSYEGYDSGVVYENDEFHIERTGDDVEVYHKIPGLQDRGALLGGYAVVYDCDKRPAVVVRRWEDYKHLHGKHNWKNYGPDMMETRCIVTAHRQQYSISGLYAPTEFADDGATVARHRTEATKEELREDLAQLEDGEEPIEAESEVVEEEEGGEPEIETTTEPGYEAPCGETFDSSQGLGGHIGSCDDCREAARETFYDRLSEYFEDGDTQLAAHRYLRDSEEFGLPDQRSDWTASDYRDATKILSKLGRDAFVNSMESWREDAGEPALNL